MSKSNFLPYYVMVSIHSLFKYDVSRGGPEILIFVDRGEGRQHILALFGPPHPRGWGSKRAQIMLIRTAPRVLPHKFHDF